MAAMMFSAAARTSIFRRRLGSNYNYFVQKCDRKFKLINNCCEESTKSSVTGRAEDFFGIEDDTGVHHVEDPAICREKFVLLFERRDSKISDETLVQTNFGALRFDVDNVPKYHGQFEDDKLAFHTSHLEEFVKPTAHEKEAYASHETVPISHPINSYVSDKNVKDRRRNSISKEVNVSLDDTVLTSQSSALESVDNSKHNAEETDGMINTHQTSIRKSCEGITARPTEVKTHNVNWGNESSTKEYKSVCQSKIKNKPSFDNKFNDAIVKSKRNRTNVVNTDGSNSDHDKTSSDRNSASLTRTHKSKKGHDRENIQCFEDSELPFHHAEMIMDDDKTIHVKNFLESDREVTNVKKENELAKDNHYKGTAYEYVKYLRNKNADDADIDNFSPYEVSEPKIPAPKISNEKLDSKGFRILSNQVPNFDVMSRDEIFKMLKKSVIYNDNDIVAIDKPYGFVCHGHTPGIRRICLSSYLDDIARFVDKDNPEPKLHMVHRLDKETTGVMLFAKTPKMANILQSLLAEKKIQKVYWALTRGVPNPEEGIVNIPLMEDNVAGRYRVSLKPDLYEEYGIKGKRGDAHEAVTYYKVLSSNENAALVHLKPQTGQKHQLRVHLGFGLRCPVLGDHKYSHLQKFAPQKLPHDMLLKLRVRQSKVRYIPMHLHARAVIIPEILSGKNLFIECKLPTHFAKNLQSLKIRKH